MNLFQHIINLITGKYTAEAVGVSNRQREHIKEQEATLNGEAEWMLEKRRNSVVKKYKCDCKEVAK